MKITYSEDQIAELHKCAKSPEYFIDTYVQIRTCSDGIIPFELYPHQADALETIQYSSDVVIATSRQSGTSSLLEAYALWYAIFHTYENVFMSTLKHAMSMNIMANIRMMYDLLPDFLRPKILQSNKSSIEFDNGSCIIVSGKSPNALKGRSISLHIWLDCAFLRYSEQVDYMENAWPGLGENSKFIIASSLGNQSSSNLFNTLYKDALAGINGFTPITFKWWYVPGRTRQWASDMRKLMGGEQWDSEYGVKCGEA